MEVERTCHVCSEEALYFCRICVLHYCSEHLCLHLSVAWENNSWTKRNIGDCDEDLRVRETTDTDILAISNSIQNNAKSLPAYTNSELQEQLNHYMYQARRIRHELARRSLSSTGSTSGWAEKGNTNCVSRLHNNNLGFRNPKASRKIFKVLSDLLRQGNLSIEQVKEMLK